MSEGVGALSTGIGETLRAARRRQGHSLGDVAASTRVRETYLAALETEEFDALGGDVYVRGFLTAYARFLGLDPAPLLEAHRHRRDGHERARGRRRRGRAGTPPRPAGLRIRSVPQVVLLVLAAVVVVALVVAGLWGGGEASAALPEVVS